MRQFNSIEVHIDAENVSSKKMGAVFSRISKYGDIRVKHCYADFSKPSVNSWVSTCNEYSITPRQANTIVSGKNTSDLELVKDCIRSMCKGGCDLIVLISSDSDFTSTVRELREAGIYTIGVGERKTPRAFQNAYNEFWFLDEFSSKQPNKNNISTFNVQTKKTNRETPSKKQKSKISLEDIVAREIKNLQSCLQKNWVLVSKLGAELKNRGIEFNVGLKDFIRNHKRFILSKDFITDAWIVTVNRNYPVAR